ncbi:MAG TPA: ABC transporter substrate-binding protein [Albitalea sp.]|uniref:ABC transporter substrate-binding protein n=1 Tax=Piscinibacter sp. TaxID=1903157 RepID=UPI002ED4FFA1
MLPRALSRLALVALWLLAAAARAADAPPAAAPEKVLRYAFRIAETGFDPPQLSDLYSRTVIANIFDSLYEWEFLARPVRMRPRTAAAMPEVSADFKTFTVRLQHGIYYADDPAFKGRKRELVAEDYVYALKRIYDPRWKSPHLSSMEEYDILGLPELRKQALAGKPFDYDREVEGVKALDRYTIQFKLGTPSPRFDQALTDPTVIAGTAREVVEYYGDKIMEHPVGTGPFKLAAWRRSTLMVLDKNPNFRDVFYNEEAPADDPLAQAAVAKLQGRKLPLVDRVEVHVIEESQPRWLAFLRSDMEVMEQVPEDFTNVAIPNNKIAPNLAKRGMYAVRYARADVSVSYFGMENPIVGGYTPDKVALRRAIALGVDLEEEIRVARRGQAIPAQSPIGPNTSGYDPAFRSEMSEFNRAKAHALLDMYGYVDRDGDGWRDMPDGSPLVLEYTTEPDDFRRQLATLWQKNMKALGIRMSFNFAKWPENLKASRTGKLMMWGLGWSTDPDGSGFLTLGYGPSKGQGNHSRFDLPAFNRLYDLQKRLPDGPERYAVMTEAKKLMIAYMPYKVHVHRIWTDLAQPWVVGYHRNVFVRDFWRYVDIDTAELAKRSK